MEIIKLPHPIAGYIYQPNEPVDAQVVLKQLYEYQELDKRCKSLSGLNLAQLINGQNEISLIDVNTESD
jgi:hypothetical protein